MNRQKRNRAARLAARWAIHGCREIFHRDDVVVELVFAGVYRQAARDASRWTRIDRPKSSRPLPVDF